MSATFTIVNQSAQKLGVELPSDLTALIGRHTELLAKVDSIAASSDLVGAVLDAIAAGRDYHDDPEVQRLHLNSELNKVNIATQARQRFDQEVEGAIVEYADSILESWDVALDRYSDAIQQAVEKLPTHDLDDTLTIANNGPETTRLWGAVKEALAMWDAAIQGFMTLAMAANMSISDKLLVMAAPDSAAFKRAGEARAWAGEPINAWLLACHGVELGLPTLGEYMERVADKQAEHQQAERRRERAQSENAHRKISPDAQKAGLEAAGAAEWQRIR